MHQDFDNDWKGGGYFLWHWNQRESESAINSADATIKHNREKKRERERECQFPDMICSIISTWVLWCNNRKYPDPCQNFLHCDNLFYTPTHGLCCQKWAGGGGPVQKQLLQLMQATP